MKEPKFNLTIKQNPSETELKVLLNKKHKELSSFDAVHKKASILLDRWVRLNFRKEGRNLGSDSWPAFKIGGRYIKGKGLDSSAKLLQDTGVLRISHVPFHNNKDAGIGSDLPYSKSHQFGTENIPMRRTLPVLSEVHSSLMGLFAQHTRKAL